MEFISAYIQASDKLNISLDFSKTGIIDSFFEEITASADQNLVITFTVDMQPQEQDFKKMYDNLSGSNEDQNSSEYYVFKKNSFTDFIKSLGDDNLFSMAIRRMLETFEDYRITEMAAIYFSLVGFLVLAWRASISDKNKLPFYLRQFKVTQEVKKKLGENPSEGSKTGRPGRVGTAYDYSYTIQNEGSATFETEYIEVTGAEGEINRQMLSERLIRFLKTQLNKNDDKISEITVIGVFFSEKNNMEFLRADIGFLKWIKERVNTWKLTK